MEQMTQFLQKQQQRQGEEGGDGRKEERGKEKTGRE